jgi:uncharacterized repeat protein (TIGR01451 family)
MRHHKLTTHRAVGRIGRRFRLPNVEALEQRSLLATITVTGTGDAIANDGVVTLREAITAANTNTAPSGDTTPGDSGLDTIAFDIAGTRVRTIHLTSALPTITEPLVVDGYTQPGSSKNTLQGGDNAVLLIELDGDHRAIDGLTIAAGGSTVRGLVINWLSSPVVIRTGGGNRIEGNFLGPDATGNTDVGTTGTGVDIQDSSDNTIGGTTPGARNLISGLGQPSFAISMAQLTAPCARNLVQGNFIGTDAAGTALISGGAAILINFAPNNTIGGTAAGARNVIGYSPSNLGSFSNAVVLIRSFPTVASATGNLVQGNFIGIDVTGTTALTGGPNSSEPVGVQLQDSPENTIGGTAPGAGNVISGNLGGGILIAGNGASNNLVQGNFVGTDASGMAAVPNSAGGVLISNASGNTIGGTAPGARNIISGNGASGIALGQSPGPNLIQGNVIGASAAGGPLGNTGDGVLLSVVSGVDGNTIGGTAAGAGNVIAFNGLNGVMSPGFPGFPFNIGNAILSNSIFANGGVGIDLALNFPGDGPTPNDPGDTDSGPNNLQNFPVLTTVASAGGSTTISGTLDSAPGTYRVEFFANDAADPTSFGEGQIFLGFSDVTIDAAKKDFTATLPVVVGPTQFVTATATDPAGNTSEFSQLVADLAVAATGSADPAPAGADLIYTITVTNTGTSAPSGPVTVTDTLPAHVTFVSATGGVTPVAGVLKLDLGIIPIGGSTTATIVVRPDAAAAGTTITNTATVTSAVSDQDESDNTVTTTTTISAAPIGHVDLSVTVTKGPAPVAVGNELTYTITVHNGGAIAATGVTLTDQLPAGATFVSATGGVTPSNGALAFDLGTLGAGAEATVSVIVVPEAGGRLINSAEAKSNEADAVATDNADSLETEVSRIATTTTVTPSSSTATTGEAVRFVVSVAHPSGPGAGPTGTVTLRDGPSDLGTALGDAGGTATFAIPDLAPGPHAITASYSGDVRYAPSDAAAVTVQVAPSPPTAAPVISAGPIAVPDEYQVLARTRLTISTNQGVLRNDLGAAGRPAQVRLVEGPGHGRLVLRPDGTFRYVPRANFHGMDSFTYVANDGQVDSAPTVVQIQVESLQLERRTVVVPGNPPDRVSVRFTLTARDARFNNELGLIRVDDAEGSIGGIRPGDPRYLRTAAAAGRMRVVFRSGESAGISREIARQGGERFLVYLVQDRSTGMALARNPEDRPGRSPHVFYADPAANPDQFDHLKAGGHDGRLLLAWEDLLGGGDRDFNDLVLTIRAIRLGR